MSDISVGLNLNFKPVEETTYKYNLQDLPTEISTSYYNYGDTSASMTKTYRYTYDEKGNVLTETLPNGQVITNTYSSDYSILLTKTIARTPTPLLQSPTPLHRTEKLLL